LGQISSVEGKLSKEDKERFKMDILFICRDALYDSMINNLTLAISFRKAGKTVGVIFTGDALHGLSNEVIRYPASLSGVEMRKTISSGADQLGLSLHSARDPKGMDIRPLLLQAKESGVLLYACPIWSSLLKLGSKLPQGLSPISFEKLLDEISSSPKVIGAV
jgi:peroxiredoxin family protein